MDMKVHPKHSRLQQVFGREGISSVEIIIEGADNSTVRNLERLAPKRTDELIEFNPFSGSLHFTARANKKMHRFLEAAQEYIPADQLSDDYRQVYDYLNSKYG